MTGSHEVRGSIPLDSTNQIYKKGHFKDALFLFPRNFQIEILIYSRLKLPRPRAIVIRGFEKTAFSVSQKIQN